MKNIWNQDTRIVKDLTKSFNFFALTLILSGLLVNTQAKRLEEASCSPRPVTVAVTEGHEVLPYHVLLHRCSGTCHNTSPRVKTCDVKNYVEIDLEVTDVNNKKKIVKMTNHTSCHCRCNCRPNEIPLNDDSCNCQCIQNCNPDSQGPVTSGTRKNDEQKFPTSYLIAMVVVGAFAMIVFIYDVMMCFMKKPAFSNLLKRHVCRKPEKNKCKCITTEV